MSFVSPCLCSRCSSSRPRSRSRSSRPPARPLPGRVHEPRACSPRSRRSAGAGGAAGFPLALLLLALVCGDRARPAGALRLPQPDQNATIVLLVDVSGSMRANDVEPTRLDAAVAAMRTFLDRLPQQFKVGLVAFSSDPEPLVAPTTDRTSLATGSASSSPRPGPRSATASEAAVQAACRSLAQAASSTRPARFLPAAIVLESDGAQNRGILDAAPGRRSSRRRPGVRIYGVRSGRRTARSNFGFGLFTNSVPVPPDPTTVQRGLAHHGGQSYTAQTANEGDRHLPDARLEHRPQDRAARDHLVVRGRRGAACCIVAVASGRIVGARLP